MSVTDTLERPLLESSRSRSFAIPARRTTLCDRRYRVLLFNTTRAHHSGPSMGDAFTWTEVWPCGESAEYPVV